MTAARTWRIVQPDGHVSHLLGDAVGTFTVTFQVANGEDVELARRGMIPIDQVRMATLEGLVETGETRLVLPQRVADQLEFPPHGSTGVRYADQRRGVRKVVDQARVFLLGRSGTFTAVVEPDRGTALIGAFVLEEFDLLVDPRLGRLIPRDPDMVLTELE